MSVETTAPFRRVAGMLIRGVADGLLGGAQGIPLAGAQVTATASVKSAASGEFIVLDPVDGTTDQNARLRNATTGEDGILLLVTDDPSIGVIGWTWHITVTAPSLNRPGMPPRTVEFDIDVPSGEGDLDLATLVPVPGNVGEDVILWRAAVEQTAANLAESNALVQDTVVDGEIDEEYRLVLKTRGGDEIVTSNIRGLPGQDGSNVLPTDVAIADSLTDETSAAGVVARDLFPPKVKTGGIFNLDEFDDVATDSARLQAANDAIVASGVEGTITVSRPLTLASTVMIDVGYVSLRFTAGPVVSQVADGPALHLHNSRDLTNARATGIANNRKSIVGLKLHGPGKASTGSVAILFHSTVGNVRGITFYDLEVMSFDTCLRFQRNAYLITFQNWHIYEYNVGLHMPGGHANYGENLRFIGGGIGTGGTAMLIDNPDGAFHLYATSIDFAQKIAQVDRGHVFMSDGHIELNSDGNPLPNAPIVSTGTGRASFVFTSGRMMLHHPSTQPSALFYAGNPYWGGGIYFKGKAEMFNVASASPVLNSGPGRFEQDVQIFDGSGSGASGGTVLTSRAANRLIDGTFTGASVLDAYLTRSEATSRTSSSAATLEQTDSSFVVRKLTAGLAEFAFDVPIRSGSTRYGMLMTISQATASSGSISVGEQFVALGPRDSRGIPPVLKANSRSASVVDLATLLTPATYAYGQNNWNRFPPAWATHFRVTFNLSAMPVSILRLSEMVVTGE